MLDALETTRAPLPLLQFTAARLWDARDAATRQRSPRSITTHSAASRARWVAGLPPAPVDDESHNSDSEREASVFVNERVYGRYRDQVHRLRGRTATQIGRDIPDAVRFSALDSSYRLVGLAKGGKLVRWSARRGLRVLRGQKTFE